MKRKILYILLGSMSLINIALTQTKVKGKVVDSQGKPLSNINVQVDDIRVKTNDKGYFKFFYPKKGKFNLTLSRVGYHKEQVEVSPMGKETHLKEIIFRHERKKIDQVDILGYKSVNSKNVGVAKSGIADIDLPQSVQIINAKLIEDQQVHTLRDVLQNSNGIAVRATRGSVREDFFARGYNLGNNNIFKNGSRTNNGGQIEASTLESVEILKGSAALLYGGVAGGAVVNLVTKKPKFELGGEVAMRYGSWQMYKPTLDIYGPLSQKVAFRFVGTGSSANSFRDEVTSQRLYINPSILYKISSNSELNFTFDYLKSDFTPDFGVGTIGNKVNSQASIHTFYNVNGAFNKTNSTNGQIVFDHNFDEKWKLSAIASMQDHQRDYYGSDRIRANEQGLNARYLGRNGSDEFTMNQQLNLTGKFKTGDIKHQLLVGLDADQSSTKTYSYSINTAGNVQTVKYDVGEGKPIFEPSTIYDYIDLLNIAGTVYDYIPSYEVRDKDGKVLYTVPAEIKKGVRTDIPGFSKIGWTKTNVYRYGGFVQDLISLSAKFKVLAGIRYTYQRTLYSDKYSYSTHVVTKDITKDINGVELGAKIDKAWSPKVGLIYQPFKSSTIYVSYANNFTPNTGYDVNYKPLSPSIIDHYEVGVKHDFFKGLLSTNLTWYRIDNNNFTEMALFDAKGTPNGDTNMKEYTGKTASSGVELDITGRLLPGLDIMAGYAYNFIRYTKTLDIMRYMTEVPDGKGGLKDVNVETSGFETGVRLIGNPANTGNMTAFYTVQKGLLQNLKIGVSAFYVGKRNGGYNNTKLNVEQDINRRIPVDPFTTLDCSLGYSIGRLSLLAKVANITNTLSYYVHENYSVNPIPPRNFMTTLRYKF